MQFEKVFKEIGMRLWIVLIGLVGQVYAQELPMYGAWRFRIDRNDVGIQEQWFNQQLEDRVQLPGSMLTNGKGDNVTLQTKWTGSIYDSSWYFNPRMAKYRQPDHLKFPFWLTPSKHYVGAAWYQKEVDIPGRKSGKHIELFLERCHTETTVWIDGKQIGTQNSLVAPHVYDLSMHCTPGRHTITIRIDNRIKAINVGPDSHSLTDHTQGNWNGIIGDIKLVATSTVWIDDVQVYPDIRNKSATVEIRLKRAQATRGRVSVYANPSSGFGRTATIAKFVKAIDTLMRIELPMGENVQLWDEFNPNLYNLHVSLTLHDGQTNKTTVLFGMRDVSIKGNQIRVNDRQVFLRGTVNNCEFPLTGYPPMDKVGWKQLFKTAKANGLNHMRFHSFCPPEAAFMAADEIGFYLQPEAPGWVNHGTSMGDGKPVDNYLYEETDRMAKWFGNHPSFIMEAVGGNEPSGRNHPRFLGKMIMYWKEKDRRRVYTGASVGNSWPLVFENEYMVKAGARGLSWADRRPESDSDYHAVVERFAVPYVTHEMGQWCVFPNFEEISKYSGVYKAKNFELFKEELAAHGMGNMAGVFLMASGALQTLCYKHEIEKALRTKDLAGFQLLGLQDFPGQGTALVGMLDAFWQTKPYVMPGLIKRFCNAVVPLMRTSKFVYTSNERFTANVELFNFGNGVLKNAGIDWFLRDTAGFVVQQGTFKRKEYAIGNCLPVGAIDIPLAGLPSATMYNLSVRVTGTSYINDWNIFIFPASLPVIQPTVHYCDTLDQKAIDVLDSGGTVFLHAAGKIVKGKEIVNYFTPVFWNTSWFKMRPPHTLGFYCDPDHPAFDKFPTSFHSDLQWWEMVNRTQVMHLEDFPASFQPLLQPIDTWFINRKLAMLLEARVGKGRLFISTIDFKTNMAGRPAARQLFYSLQSYVQSDKFNPLVDVPLKTIQALFTTPSYEIWNGYTKDAPDELKIGR